MVIGAGAILYDHTGRELGRTIAPVQITLVVDAKPAIEALTSLQAQLRLCAEATKAMNRAFGNARLETLRRQAKRKGRPGWRAIRIPKGPGWSFAFEPARCGTCGEEIQPDPMTGTTCACARSAEPFALLHDSANRPDEQPRKR